MKIENEFIPFEQALALKELGFDEPCFGYHTNDKDYSFILDVRNLKDKYKEETKAPTYSQTFRFFREKYFKMCFVYYDVEYKFCFCIGYNDKTKGFKTYEEAELACLKKLIEIVNNE